MKLILHGFKMDFNTNRELVKDSITTYRWSDEIISTLGYLKVAQFRTLNWVNHACPASFRVILGWFLHLSLMMSCPYLKIQFGTLLYFEIKYCIKIFKDDIYIAQSFFWPHSPYSQIENTKEIFSGSTSWMNDKMTVKQHLAINFW